VTTGGIVGSPETIGAAALGADADEATPFPTASVGVAPVVAPLPEQPASVAIDSPSKSGPEERKD